MSNPAKRKGVRFVVYRKDGGWLRSHKPVRVDIQVGRGWYWLGVERCAGRWLIGFGFGRAII